MPPLSCNTCKRRLKYLEANFRCMFIRGEAGGYLLVGMNVIPKITQSMAELFHIRLKQIDFAANIYELSKTPFVKALRFTVLIFGLAEA